MLVSFDTELNWDSLMIHDGPDASSPIFSSGSTVNKFTVPVGAWHGTATFSANGQSFTSTHSSGALTFVFRSDSSGTRSGWEAEVTCGPPPSCIKPENLTALNVTSIEADLSWDAQATATLGYQWVVMASGDAPVVDGSEVATGNTASDTFMDSVSGLSSNTSYDAYVRSICDGGEFSDWSDVSSFTPPPANDNFADAIAVTCGVNYLGSTVNATLDESDAPVDVADMDAPNVWYTYTGSGTAEFVTLDLCNSTYDTSILVFTGTSGDLTLIADNDDFCSLQSQTTFTSDGSTTYHIAIEGWNSASVGDYDLDVTCVDVPSCLEPMNLAASNITSDGIELEWDEEATASLGYQWVVMASGDAPVVDGSEVATGNTASDAFMASVSGLSSDTTYDAYVRSICDGGEFSDWSSVEAFTTTPDYCGADNFVDSGGVSANYSLDETTITTIFPDTAGDVVFVEFLSFDTETGYDGLLIYDGPDTSAPLIDSGFINVGFPGSILPNGAWNGDSASGETFISSHASGSLTFAFISDDLFNTPGWEAEVTCGPPPTCFSPENLTVSNTTANGADISWDTVDTAVLGYQWVVMATGVEPVIDGSEIATGNTATDMLMATVSGLNSGSFYEVYIRSVCNGGEFSSWSNAEILRTAPVCGESFFDIGGTSANYPNFSNETITISPDNSGDVVSVAFSSFSVEEGWDGLLIYDGPDTSSPLIDSGGVYPGGNAPTGSWSGEGSDSFSAEGETFTSTHPSGSLTFVFVSDDSFNFAGWEATVTCAPPPTCVEPENLSASNFSATSADLSWDTEATATLGYQWVVMTSGATPVVDGSEAATRNTASDILEASVSGLDGGTTYDAYVRSICDGGEFSDWSDEVSFTTLPANDNFTDAIAVACGSNYTGSTAGAIVDGDFASPNVWYSFTGSGIIQSVTLDLCDSGYDTRVRVYTGTVGDLTQIIQNDDFCGLQSQLTFESDGSTTYYISVEGFNASSIGNYDLDVSCINLPTLAFQEVFTESRGIVSGSVVFEDADYDGDQDFLLSGVTAQNQFGFTGGQISRLYRNNGSGSFQQVFGTPFMGLSYSSVSFKDINNDNVLDIISSGENYTTGDNFVKYYVNDGAGDFSETAGLPFPNMDRVDFKFADFDGDGDDDVLFVGLNGANGVPNVRFYKNQGSNASPSYVFETTGLPTVIDGSIDVADVDGNGTIDVFISGRRPAGNKIARLFLNDGNFGFTGITQFITPFVPVDKGDSAFADVDDDGDQDLLISGKDSNNNNVLKLYLNDGSGTFTEAVDVFSISSNYLLVAFDFADIDGDGDFDVLFTGYNTSNLSRVTTIWENLLYSPSTSTRPTEDSPNFNINFEEDEVVFGNNFKVFPNPTDKGYFTIYTPDLEGEVSVSITDLHNRTILSQDMYVRGERVTVRSENLSAGIYIVKLSKGQNTFSSKLIVE